jgi:thiol-disulfide isomerase/thioredoxin
MEGLSVQDRSYFTKSKYVKEIGPKDFKEIATWKLKDDGCCIVLFYADWCPHCKAIKDEWEEFAKIAAFMNVYAFNCAKYASYIDKIKEDMPQLVTGYPTIVFYSKGDPTETYRDERTRQKLLKASMRVCND